CCCSGCLRDRLSFPTRRSSDLAVRFGGVPLFEGITFQVERGERWAVIGRNGSGKTTLMSLVEGRREPDTGVIARAGGLTIAMMRSEEHTSELQSRENLVCRLLL